MNIDYLKLAGALSFIAAAMHLAIIFGAGERRAEMAAQGQVQPTLITLSVAAVLGLWGVYAWSAAGIFPQLPLMKLALILITLVYLTRGVLGLLAPFISSHPQVTQNSVVFWVWSSIICLAFGLIHLKGDFDKWFG
jgi:putative oxidoreductase